MFGCLICQISTQISARAGAYKKKGNLVKRGNKYVFLFFEAIQNKDFVYKQFHSSKCFENDRRKLSKAEK